MSDRYGLDSTRYGFGAYVRKAYDQEATARQMRDYLIAQLRDGKLDALLLSSLAGVPALPGAIVEKAAFNIIDYYLEPLIFNSMSAQQLVDYIKRVRRVLTFDQIVGIDRTAPLWISTLHHACAFSVIAEIAAELLREHHYRRFVFLHNGEQHETHIAMLNLFMLNVLDVQADYFILDDALDAAWTRGLGPDAAVFYFADSAGKKSERKAEIISDSRFSKLADFTVKLEMPPDASAFATRLDAIHLTVDYPEGGLVRVKPFKADASALHCPLHDWIFWPLLSPRSQ